MASTTNRGRRPRALRAPHVPHASPKPAQVIAARQAAGLTQTEAAAKIYASLRAWQAYEGEGENARPMHPGLFELFLIKTGQPRPR